MVLALFVSLLLGACELAALSPRESVTQYTRTLWTQAQGLSQSVDRDAVGTHTLPGRPLPHLHPESGLPTDYVGTILEDHAETLWLGTGGIPDALRERQVPLCASDRPYCVGEQFRDSCGQSCGRGADPLPTHKDHSTALILVAGRGAGVGAFAPSPRVTEEGAMETMQFSWTMAWKSMRPTTAASPRCIVLLHAEPIR